jgi:signal transduction histidine kinase
MTDWLPRLVASLPATVHAKLLVAFSVMAGLLILVGTAGLQALRADNRRAEEMVKLQRKVAAYRQVQHDTTVQLLSVASALLVPEERTLEATLRQLNQFGYDLDRLQFVARDEVELLGQVQKDYEQFVHVVHRVIELIRRDRVAEGRELQFNEARPLAERLERLLNQLVNRAEAEMVAMNDVSHEAYATSRWVVIGFAVGSVGLALLLGYAISWSLIGPMKRMDTRFREIAAGDFSRRVAVANRDELGALAANLNRMNDELGRLYRQIDEASRHKSQFLASMSHEFRTPLNAIIGFSEVLLDPSLEVSAEKRSRFLSHIFNSGKHLLGLINDILDLSKVEAGRLELEIESAAISDVLDAAESTMKPLAVKKAIDLRVESDGQIPRVPMDAARIRQVVLNLVGNAIKFTPEGGQIWLRADTKGEVLRVEVGDTGPGIPVEDHERIFLEFEQARVGSAGSKPEGTGLGLALARKLVEMHGGKIWVESKVDEGSRFYFTLPIP